MPRVIIARHGETKLNVNDSESAERIRGWKDIPLDGEGVRQANALAKKLSEYDVREIYSSPLSRAFDTACAIASACHVGPVHKEASLLPWHLGSLQGELVMTSIPAVAAHIEHENEEVDKGESFATFRERFLSFLKDKCKQAESWAKDDIMVLVCHSRNVQITKAWLAAGCPDDLTIDVPTMNSYDDETGTGSMLVVKV